MFIVDDETGDITLTQGDTGEYIVNGIKTDQYYTIYFAVQDKNRNPIGSELKEDCLMRSSVTIKIPKTLTDLLTVNKNQDSAEYKFGLKLCDKLGNEDTLVIGNKEIGEDNTITVYPKKVEGDS